MILNLKGPNEKVPTTLPEASAYPEHIMNGKIAYFDLTGKQTGEAPFSYLGTDKNGNDVYEFLEGAFAKQFMLLDGTYASITKDTGGKLIMSN